MPSIDNKDQIVMKYSLSSVKNIMFYFISLEEAKIVDFDILKVENAISHKIILRPKEKAISIYFKILFRYDKNIEFVKYAVRADFVIYNYHEIIKKSKPSEEKKSDIPTRFLVNFFGITISTARGMLASYLMNTDYAELFIPLFHPDEIIKTFIEDKA